MEALSSKETFYSGGPIVVKSTTLLKATRLFKTFNMQSSEEIERMLQIMIWCSSIDTLGQLIFRVLLLLMVEEIPFSTERVVFLELTNRHLFACSTGVG